MELSKSFADHKVKVRLKCTILIKGGLLIKWLLNLKALGMVWVIERINFVSTTNPNIRLSNLILTRFSMYQEVVIAPYSASKEKQSWLGSMRDFLMQASTSSVMCETSWFMLAFNALMYPLHALTGGWGFRACRWLQEKIQLYTKVFQSSWMFERKFPNERNPFASMGATWIGPNWTCMARLDQQ